MVISSCVAARATTYLVQQGGLGRFPVLETPDDLATAASLTWWSPAKFIIDDWAGQFVQLANRRPGEVVKDTPTFDLLVW